MLELRDLTYAYHKSADALSGITASVSPGIHLMLGENGAGKTTLLHVMAGLLTPKAGDCLLCGVDVAARMPETQAQIVFLADDAQIPARTVNAWAGIHAPFYPQFSADDLQKWLGLFGLTGDEPLKSMSLGNRRKAAIAYTLALHCPLTLLDEPTNGLDINAKKLLRRIMLESLADNQIIMVSTHTVEDLEQLYDSVMMISRGHVVMNERVDALGTCLSFVSSPAPLPDALYGELVPGGYRSIIAGGDYGESTQVDFNLLYSALMSERSNEILNQITRLHDGDNSNNIQ